MAKTGIQIEIPGLGAKDVLVIASDFTGTLSFDGKLIAGVRERLTALAERVDIYVLTADTFGTAERELVGLPLARIVKLEGKSHDTQKAAFIRKLGARHVAVFGNGNNDRRQLKATKQAGGLAIAVDNGEGCAVDAFVNAHLFITGIANALDLLLQPNRLKATLRF